MLTGAAIFEKCVLIVNDRPRSHGFPNLESLWQLGRVGEYNARANGHSRKGCPDCGGRGLSSAAVASNIRGDIGSAV